MDGRSLLALLDDPETEIHRSLPLINVWGPKEVHSLGVVTKDQKYVYWPYAGEGYEPTEEIYHLDKDPHEMTPPSASDEALPAMRALYDQAVEDWKRDAVPYHRYQEFGPFFDRAVPWESKSGPTPSL